MGLLSKTKTDLTNAQMLHLFTQLAWVQTFKGELIQGN